MSSEIVAANVFCEHRGVRTTCPECAPTQTADGFEDVWRRMCTEIERRAAAGGWAQFHTADHKKPFRARTLGASIIEIEVSSTGNTRQIKKAEYRDAYKKLVAGAEHVSDLRVGWGGNVSYLYALLTDAGAVRGSQG